MSQSPAPRGNNPPMALSAWRGHLARIKQNRDLLDALLSPRNAAELVQQLPAEDLHLFVHRIGLADCAELLALTSGEQVRDMLDMEIWAGDTLEIERLDPWLHALMRAGPEEMVERVMALDDSMINWIARRTVRVLVVEDPDGFDPPDVEHVMTPDNRLCIYFPRGEERELPTKVFLDTLMRLNPLYCTNLLVHSSAALDSVLQEDAYRWRTARMADRGYVDYYEALVIYTAPPATLYKPAVSGTERAPHRWLAPLRDPGARLGAAFGALDPKVTSRVEMALSYLMNMALSADRIEAWDFEGQESVLRRVHAGLVMGLDVLGGSDPESDAQVLTDVALALIFRHGYAVTLESAKPLRPRAVKEALGGNNADSLGLSDLARWANALLERHPQRPDGQPFVARSQVEQAVKIAEMVADLALRSVGRPENVSIANWLLTEMVRDFLGLEGPGALPLERLTDAHRALFDAESSLRPEAREAARAWWRRTGGKDPSAAMALLIEVKSQIGEVAPDDLEPRFVPFVLTAS